MAKISKIESALQQINEAAFQELCNRYLYYIYNPNSINPTGSVIGKEKTRKGTPDTFFVDEKGEFIFIEYTTQEQLGKEKSFYSKIKGDILKCFDEEKTGVLSKDISKVIVCHTGKLSASEIKELHDICLQFNDTCLFEQYGISDIAYGLMNYPGLISEYLDIEIGTGQLMEPAEFIAQYEKADLKISAPISNTFFGREKELQEGTAKLETNSILIVSGASGTGKSRYALELCSLFVKSHTGYKFLCVGNKGVSLFDDLHNQLNASQNYLLLVDDANRIVSNFSFILYLLKENRAGKIKIVLTVRDYALPVINNMIVEFPYQEVALELLSDEDIAGILNADPFNITNSFYVDKIRKISRGNARIAVMCAMIVDRQQSLSFLNDVSQLYEVYFKEPYDKIRDVDEVNALKVLGLISFFRVISKDKVEINKGIFSIFEIEEDLFWEICDKLNEYEFVDLFGNHVVKISDQILSTYLFYKVFFETKLLDFGLLVRYFIDFDSNFYDSINPVLTAYDYRNIKDDLNAILTDYWTTLIEESSHEEIYKVIKIFSFCCETQSLIYLKRYIENLPEIPIQVYLFEYDQNRMNSRAAYGNSVLSLLVQFRHSLADYSRLALELMLKYVERKPQEVGFLVYLLKEMYGFKKENYLYGDDVQHTLIDFLSENIMRYGSTSLYAGLMLHVTPKFLETHVTDTNNLEGNKIHIYNFDLSLTDSIKSLRKKIWESFVLLYPENRESIYHIISHLKFPRSEDEKSIWEYDSTIVLPSLLDKLDYSDFAACEAANYYLGVLEKKSILFDEQIKEKATNSLYDLSKQFVRTYGYDWRQAAERRKKELKTLCENYTFKDYVQLFDDLTLIKKSQRKKSNYDFPINQIIANIAEKDIFLFLEFLGYAIKNYEFQYHPHLILCAYFNNLTIDDYNPLLKCLQENARNKRDWLITFHDALPDKFIQQDKDFLINHFYEILHVECHFWGIGNILNKYSSYVPANEIYVQVLLILHGRLVDDSLRLVIHPDFFEKGFDYCLPHFNEYSQLYYRCKASDRIYDYDNFILKKILAYKSDEIISLFQTVYKDADSIRDFDEQPMTFVWELENYEEILDISIAYFLGLHDVWRNEELVQVFFTDLGDYEDKAHLYIRRLIDRHFSDDDYMDMVFSLIASCMGNYKCEYIQQYLMLEPDVDKFKKRYLFPTHSTYCGSRIPYIQSRIEELKGIISEVKKLSPAIDFIEHIAYLESQIQYCKRDLEWEAKYEFQDKYSS